jgi:peptidoglycan/LPS O-acetylase OafA/YrhL
VRYNPALDGLRGVAIGLVVLDHMLRPVFPGGWVGVDVFFVLSGYLITSILLHELQETGGISMTNFYARRALRLLPPLALLAAFQLIRSIFSAHGQEIREATLVGVAYLENWNTVFKLWPTDVMGHTWSLATEEDFYLLWPLLLPLVVRKRPLFWLAVVAAAITFARLAEWHSDVPELTLQNALWLRPVGLLVGCALAFLPIARWRLPAIIAPAGLAVLLLIALAVPVASGLAFALGPLAGSLATGLVIVGTQHGGATAAALSLSPVRYLGRISYGLYLYHSPIYALGEQYRIHTAFHLFTPALAVLILLLSVLSYEYVEKPILGLKGRFQRATTASPHAEGLRAV